MFADVVEPTILWTADDEDELMVVLVNAIPDGLTTLKTICSVRPGSDLRSIKTQYRNALRVRSFGDDRRSGEDRRSAIRIDTPDRRQATSIGKYAIPTPAESAA